MKEKPPLWERTEYDIISETETDEEMIGVIRSRYNGTKIVCHIPKHTYEEAEKISAALTISLMQTAFTGQDISSVKNMEITTD
jgi:hypothetical protein